MSRRNDFNDFPIYQKTPIAAATNYHPPMSSRLLGMSSGQSLSSLGHGDVIMPEARSLMIGPDLGPETR